MSLVENLTELSKSDDFKVKLGNVLTLRNFGNKLHGDNLEVAMVAWINHYTDIKASHVGKDFFRSGENSDIIISSDDNKLNEYIKKSKLLRYIKNSNLEFIIETFSNNNLDIPLRDNGRIETKKFLVEKMTNHLYEELSQIKQDINPLSLKCYGMGPLQLLTDPKSGLIKSCKSLVDDLSKECYITKEVVNSDSFQSFKDDKVLCVIYDESDLKYSLILIDMDSLYKKVEQVKYTPRTYKENGGIDKYEIFKFYDEQNKYLFEVRYGEGGGGKAANALQRGLWTNTKKENSSFLYICKDINYQIDDEYLNNYIKAVAGL